MDLPLVVWPLVWALTAQVGASSGAPEVRKDIREFIEQINPKFPDADEAANQLLYCEKVTGVNAKLMAALIAQERRWQLKRNGVYAPQNLTQVLHSTGRRMFGRAEARTWQENILWGAYYMKYCLRAEKGNVTNALRAYNGGPGYRQKPITKKYARAVLYYRGKMKP